MRHGNSSRRERDWPDAFFIPREKNIKGLKELSRFHPRFFFVQTRNKIAREQHEKKSLQSYFFSCLVWESSTPLPFPSLPSLPPPPLFQFFCFQSGGGGGGSKEGRGGREVKRAFPKDAGSCIHYHILRGILLKCEFCLRFEQYV